MKAFERIQREGPLRRSREKNPTKRTPRRISTKSESTDSKASEDCPRNEDEQTEKMLTSVGEENQNVAKIDEDIKDISRDSVQVETVMLQQNQVFSQMVKCESKEEKKEDEEEEDGKTSVKNTDDVSSELVEGVEMSVKVEKLESYMENDVSELDAGKISSMSENKPKNLKEDVKIEDSSLKSDNERKFEEDLEQSAMDVVDDEEFKADNPKETEAGAEAKTEGAKEDTVLRPRRSRRVRHPLKASSTEARYPLCSKKEIQSSTGGNSTAENDVVPDNSTETKEVKVQAEARPKGRPRRMTSKGHGVKETERKSVKGSFEDRVRTRSCTNDENGRTCDEFGKHFKATGDKVSLFIYSLRLKSTSTITFPSNN